MANGIVKGTNAPMQALQTHCEIRKKLRDSIHEIHVRLDHHPLLAGITKPSYSLVSYQHVLLGYFHLYRAVESAITDALGRQRLDFDYRPRRKLSWIMADLEFFGLDPLAEKYSPLHGIESFATCDPGQLVGTLYVIEGSTLGGQVIARHVARNLGLTSVGGARFFNGYGVETPGYWSEFEQFMNLTCVEETSQSQACRAAVTTFLLVEKILDEYHAKLDARD